MCEVGYKVIVLSVIVVTDNGTKMCMDPEGSGAILRAGEKRGARPARWGRRQTVSIRQWRRLDVSRISGDMGNGFDTTPKHPSAQSTYHCVCHVQQSVISLSL